MPDAPMIAFLSDEWLGALEAALRAAPSPGGGRGGDAGGAPPRLSFGQIVTAAEGSVPPGAGLVEGEVRYTISLGGDLPPEVRIGTVAGATVTLVTDYTTARALSRGAEPLAAALVAGRVKVRGDAGALLETQELLSALAPALAALAAATRWS